MPSPAKPEVDWGTAQPIKSGDVDWGSAQPIGGASSAPPQEGFLASLGHTFGVGAREGEQYLKDEQEHPWRTSLENAPLVPQIESLWSGGKRIGGELKKAFQGATEGNPYSTAEHTAYALPFVGAGIQRGVEQLGPQGEMTPGAAGTAVGTAMQTAPMVIGGVDAAVPGRTPMMPTVSKLTDPLHAYRSPFIPPEEAAARGMADILKPNPVDYNQTVRNLQNVGPYIREAAAKYKNPLEFGKAAQAAGQQQTGFFKQQFIEPDEMRLGDAYKDVGRINDELRPMYRARSMGEVMTKEAQDKFQQLEQRRDKLNDFIYNEASGRTGVPREQIQAINQRGGQLQNIGDVADAAQAQRRLGKVFTPTGMSIPMGPLDRIGRAVNFIRGMGDPEAPLGRKLGKVMQQMPGQPEPLPDEGAIRDYRNASNQEELGNLRRVLENQAQNRANIKARTQVARPILEEQGQARLRSMRRGEQ
jgi:hypothetical protein